PGRVQKIHGRASGQNPSPRPLPETERGRKTENPSAPPLRFGEGAGGRGGVLQSRTPARPANSRGSSAPRRCLTFLRNSLDPFGEVRRVQNLVPHRVRSRRAPLRAQPGRPLGGGNRPLDGEARPAALEDREPRRGQELR